MSFLETLYNLRGNSDDGENSTEQTCVTKIPHSDFHLWLLVPAVTLLVIISFTIQRKNKLLWCLNGRPGAVFPMDILGESNRFSYLAAWGSIAYLAAEMVVEQKFAFKLTGKYGTVFNAVLSMVIYGLDYFPLFAALALQSVIGYTVGTLYAWMFFAVNVYKEVECEFNTLEARMLLLLRDLPNLICLGYLSISLPVRLIQSLYRKSISCFTASEMVTILGLEKEVCSTSEALHLKNLLGRPKPEPMPSSTIGAKLTGIVRGLIHSWVYQNQKNFRYSARVLSVMFVGGLLLYKVTLELMVTFLSIFDLILKNMGAEIDKFEDPEDEVTSTGQEIVYILYYVVQSTKICFIVSMTVACAFGYLTILHMLSMYRTNLFALYKGDTSFIRHRSERSNASLLVGSMRYAGYQVGYIAWGFIIQFVVLFIVSFALAVVISLMIAGEYQWLLNILSNAWPALLVTLMITITQFILAKVFFLQGNDLAIDNRRLLFSVTFFFFFYNIFLGLISCLLRIIKSIVLGTMFMSRLDHSALSRRFEMMDPGFAAYVGFIQIEATHTHPVLVMFLRFLMLDGMKDQDSLAQRTDATAIQMEETEKKPLPKPGTNKRARSRWCLMYTLYNNPSLRAQRKQYILFIREMRARLQERYNLSNSAIGELMTGMTTVMNDASLSDVNINVGENGDAMAGPMMNMKAMFAMSRFMLALQKDGNAVDLGSVFGHQNTAFGDSSAVTSPSQSLWKRAAGKAYVQDSVEKQNLIKQKNSITNNECDNENKDNTKTNNDIDDKDNDENSITDKADAADVTCNTDL